MFSIRTLGTVAALAMMLGFANVSFGQEVLTQGEVVAINEPAGKISVKHGPI